MSYANNCGLEVKWCQIMPESLRKSVAMILMATLATVMVGFLLVGGPESGMMWASLVVIVAMFLLGLMWGIPIKEIQYGELCIRFERE